MTTTETLRDQFLLNPDIIYLNHGSYGACPRPVFEVYQQWQVELERNPVAFIGRRSFALLAEARARLAAYLNVPADDLVYFPNPTTAFNMVARSLITPDHGRLAMLQPGDEILTTEHEYPAMEQTWRFIEAKTGARYVHQPIPVPVSCPEEFVEAFWAGVTPRTRIVFLSHITCQTSLIFPVAEICRRAREAGLLSIVDGAHAPGQIPLDLSAVGADIYIGACHKWLCAPKGSAFLYARPEAQAWLEPLIISRGWGPTAPDGGSGFVTYNEAQGTRDISAFLAVPAAIEFQAAHDWERQRQRCHELASYTRARISALTGLAPLCPDAPQWYGQMVSIPLPEVDITRLSERLLRDYHIEVPLMRWNGLPLIRVSFQAYNDRSDADALIDALAELLPEPVGLPSIGTAPCITPPSPRF